MFLFFISFLFKKFSNVALPVERVHVHVVGIELKFSLYDIVQHDCLLCVHAERAFTFDRGNSISEFTLFDSTNTPLLLVILV